MTPLIRFHSLYPDTHAQKIAAHFGHLPRADQDADRQALERVLAGLKAIYIICFTNRCGSNFLAQCLASDGRLRQATEGLNHEVVINQSKRNELRSFEAYLTWLIQRQRGPHQIFGIKASASQFIDLVNRGLLAAVRDRVHVVHISRKDPFEQAVSYYIASRTRQWTSTQPAQEATLDYRPDEILGTAEAITRQNAVFGLLFDLLGLKPLRVDYDKLVTDTDKMVRRVGRRVGLADLKLVREKLTYEKQADERNQALLQRLVADFSLHPERGLGAPADEE